MKRFVVPPTWPSPPRRSWVPPKTWRPDPSWPAAPDDWNFWVDGKGSPVRGPIGRYAGPPQRVMYAGVGALVLCLGVGVWALSAIGLFNGDSDQQPSAQVVDGGGPTPSSSPTVVPPLTTPPPVPKTTVPTTKPTVRPTQRPTKQPTKARTTDRPDPTPTKTKATATPTPPRRTTTTPRPPGTSTPPSEEEILRQYCRQRGWPVEWCDPNNWNAPTGNPRPSGH